MHIKQGWLSGVRRCLSPNQNPRPDGTPISLIVVHNISLPPDEFGGQFIEDFFQNKLDASIHPYFATIAELEVSAHLLIKRTGEVVQFVSFDDRAWHAGASSYLGCTGCNDYSVGIELEGSDFQPFTKAQYAALCDCVHAINQAYPTTKNHIAGHSDIAPARKTDPGAYFDWMYFRKQLARPG